MGIPPGKSHLFRGSFVPSIHMLLSTFPTFPKSLVWIWDPAPVRDPWTGIIGIKRKINWIPG